MGKRRKRNLKNRGFKAATWNILHGVPLEKVRAKLRELKRKNVTLILVQEATKAGIREAFMDEGFATYKVDPEFMVAWDVEHWYALDREEVLLSEQSYRVGKGLRWARAASVVLEDNWGRELEALSYHTPAHVQVANPDPDRVKALRQAMTSLRDRAAKRSTVLYGGDDNVDEDKYRASYWRFMRKQATGLRQVMAPLGTLHRRRIDDFRIKGLRVGRGAVLAGTGDHKIHVRTFYWKKK